MDPPPAINISLGRRMTKRATAGAMLLFVRHRCSSIVIAAGAHHHPMAAEPIASSSSFSHHPGVAARYHSSSTRLLLRGGGGGRQQHRHHHPRGCRRHPPPRIGSPSSLASACRSSRRDTPRGGVGIGIGDGDRWHPALSSASTFACDCADNAFGFRCGPRTIPPHRGGGSGHGGGGGDGRTLPRRRRAHSLFGSSSERAVVLPPGTSIRDALLSSMRMLEDRDVPEPDESALHLLSHALGLDWDDGHRMLREVMTLTLTLPLPSTHPPPPPSGIDEDPSSISYRGDGPIRDLARRTLSSEQRLLYLSFLERRVRFEPLQYIVGRWDFHHLSGLRIRRPMLCPRPETEELVELVLSDIDRLIRDLKIDAAGGGRGERRRKVRVLDVGCGTGAIGIAIARRYPGQVRVVALDVSPEAVELSNENAALFLSGGMTGGGNGNDIDIIGDGGHDEGVSSSYQAILCSARDFTNNDEVMQSSDSESSFASGGERRSWEMDFDIVVSNPPYIPTGDMSGLSKDVSRFESHGALCGGDDGLDVIRDIVLRLPEWLSSPTTAVVAADDDRTTRRMMRSRHCWMEVDDSHPAEIGRWLAPGSEESILRGVEYSESREDFCGRDRFVKLVRRDDK